MKFIQNGQRFYQFKLHAVLDSFYIDSIIAGNNGGTLIGTFNEILGDSDSDDGNFEGFVFENAHATKIVYVHVHRYFYSLQKCNNT